MAGAIEREVAQGRELGRDVFCQDEFVGVQAISISRRYGSVNFGGRPPLYLGYNDRTRSRSLAGPVSAISPRKESPDRANLTCHGTRKSPWRFARNVRFPLRYTFVKT